jgi:uroporphyrinogen-III decarboxylase
MNTNVGVEFRQDSVDGDFSAHNAEVQRIWAAYRTGRPERVPVTFSLVSRMILLDPKLNQHGWTARQIFEDPQAMWDLDLAFQRWVRFEVPQDAEMGLPEAWNMSVTLWNCYEAGWFGCEVVFPEGELPDTRPIFEERKERLYETPMPDPLTGNLMGRALEFHQLLVERASREEFLGRPVRVNGLPLGTDGPFTVACNLRGATEACTDLIEDEPYFHDLMTFVTDGIIARMKAWKRYAGLPEAGIAWFADDSIQMLSVETYRRCVLPYHRKVLAAFNLETLPAIHLCGRAQHLFRTLVDELGVRSFEVGFPTDLGRARAELGEDVELIGNVHPMLLCDGPPDRIRSAVREVCASGVGQGGRFILREGNNCAPCTPRAHFAAMYQAGKEFGSWLLD